MVRTRLTPEVYGMTLPESSARPLDVTIVGAGIVGLATAIALRRHGHHVKIFEASQIKTEIGAGVGLQRNAVRILERLGYCRENLKPVDYDGIVVFDAKTGASVTHPWLVPRNDETPDLFCLRSDLHDELKRLATGEGEGPSAQLLLDTRVVACDPEAGTITLRSGEICQADVIIGADGVHSTVRTSILGRETKAPGSGWSCFRCLFDASGAEEIPELAWLSGGINGARNVAWREDGPFRMFFIYKCRSGAIVNFVGFYTDPKQSEPGWTPVTTRGEILDTFQSFHPKFLRIFDLPIASPLMKWQLRVTPILPTWIRGRAALLGDAAHGTLPLLGQGLAMGLEDAATLGCLFPLGTTKENVPIRLGAYQTLRKERGEYVNTESVAQATQEKRGTYIRSREMQALIFEHDVIKNTQEYYRAHFGRGGLSPVQSQS